MGMPYSSVLSGHGSDFNDSSIRELLSRSSNNEEAGLSVVSVTRATDVLDIFDPDLLFKTATEYSHTSSSSSSSLPPVTLTSPSFAKQRRLLNEMHNMTGALRGYRAVKFDF